MTTLHERTAASVQASIRNYRGPERRRFRRHDLEVQGIAVQRWQGTVRATQALGTIVDISAAGLRVRSGEAQIRPGSQIRVRMELPPYAGICPFVDVSSGDARPKHEWVGWLAVNRVQEAGDGRYDVAGTLLDMDDIDRGMLGLYLSTQPLAA